MFRQRLKLVAFSTFVLDLCVTAGSFFLAYWVRDAILGYHLGKLFSLGTYLWLLLIIIITWSILLNSFGVYKRQKLKSPLLEFKKLWLVSIIGTVVIGGSIYLFKNPNISRLFIIVFGISNIILMPAGRYLVLFIGRYRQNQDYFNCNVLIAGTGETAMKTARLLEEHKDWGYNLVGFVTGDDSSEVVEIEGKRLLGSVQDIPKIIDENVIDEIIFCVSKEQLEGMEDIFLFCEELGIRSRILLDFFPHTFARCYLENVEGLPLLTFSPVPSDEFKLAVKRVADIIISMAMIIILSPIFLVAGIMIKITSPGPVLFRQKRCGLNKRTFTLFKFRTMSEGAEEKQKELEALNEADGPVFKIKNDPRITPVGKIFRKFSIDELPQLWNVFKGEMSIVGPRPPIPEEVEKYGNRQRRRLSMKPGLTCLWQVNGRNRLGFDEWVNLDLKYIDDWSLMLDFKIFFKTVPTVILGKGAM